MAKTLPNEDFSFLKKRNRIKKLSFKIHKVHHESGRSIKGLWRRIVEASRSK